MACTYEEKISALNDLREYLDAAIASGEITEAEARTHPKKHFITRAVGVMKELDLLILLLTPKMATLSYLAFSYNSDNKEPYEYGCAVIIFILTYFCYWVAGKIGKVDLAGSLGG